MVVGSREKYLMRRLKDMWEVRGSDRVSKKAISKHVLFAPYLAVQHCCEITAGWLAGL